jgi:methyl-accepting chemotaxis protein
MTIRKRLMLNMIVTIVGMATIGIVSILGLYTLKDKIRTLTTESTPFQIKTLELTKQLQEHAVNLFAVSSSATMEQFRKAREEAETTLDRIEPVLKDLRSLKGEKTDSSEIMTEVAGITREMTKTTEERIRTEQEASQALSLSGTKVAGTIEKLNNFQQSMKKLQDSAAGNLTQSSRNSRQITTELTEIQKIKDAVQELQIGLAEIQTAATPSVVNTAKGRIKFALQNMAQSDKAFKPVSGASSEFGKLTLGPKGVGDLREALLAASHSQKLEEEFKSAYQRSKNSLDTVIMQVNEAIDGASLSSQSLNIALDGTIKASEEVRRVMALNSEMVTACFSIQNLVATLFASKSGQDIDAAQTALSGKLKLVRHLAKGCRIHSPQWETKPKSL